MTERWRCFVAVPLDDALRAALQLACRSWADRPDLAEVRWSEPTAWHLTLVFIGDVDAGAVPNLEAIIREVAAGHRAMQLPAGGVGAFPTPARARVAWYGVEDPGARLAGLAADLSEALGVAGDEPYRPHITLARAPGRPLDLRRWVIDAAEAVPASIVVDRIEVLRSLHGRGPAAYETLASMPLPESPR